MSSELEGVRGLVSSVVCESDSGLMLSEIELMLDSSTNNSVVSTIALVATAGIVLTSMAFGSSMLFEAR